MRKASRLSQVFLLVCVLSLCVGGETLSQAIPPGPIVGDEGPLRVVAVTESPAISLPRSIPISNRSGVSVGGYQPQPLLGRDVLMTFRHRLTQALLNVEEVQVLEAETQALLDAEIRNRIERGVAPHIAMTEVGQTYRLDEFVRIDSLVVECDHRPGSLFTRTRTSGSLTATVSFISVTDGTTILMAEERAGLGRDNEQPPTWFGEIARLVANELVAKRFQVPPIHVVEVKDERLIINRGSDSGIRAGQKFVLRAPPEQIGDEMLPGERIGEIAVTDRIGRGVAECSITRVFLNDGRRGATPDLLRHIRRLLELGTPPEAVEE